ncbi:3-carboxy-cis,cis-muconate cycloisomerase [Mitsuaria sp. BK045]|uniref:lyase family protein n=1 Tax=unclassified Roseateles TaxID=2626991 RepID=UPI0016112996|nr:MULTISPECIES: lyase family protein [unclassified Roseateles]MBB3294584.1 3-carboxy-cis,cis-muconate cycloisomerase [Mitsuaria sp. BK041]MBB3363800.1 3-carboxy-cis,cis-muconate cycloisomerase [Mitsuaria sp. BK045]
MLFEAFLSSTAMESVFSPTAVVQSMMDVEAALARAAARVGMIPAPAAQAIASLCRAELYDVPALVAAAPRSGNLALPVVQRLRETVALFDPSAAVYVHRGASAQDLVDTAMVLRTREALRLIDDDLQQLCARLLELAERHTAVPLLGRTMMQPAQVISLRFKLMNWLMPLLRSAERLREQGQASLLLQLGGAVGTLDAMGDRAEDMLAAVAAELSLPLPDMCWHTQRDRWLRLGMEVGLLCGNLGKLAQDFALMAQAEVDELNEPPGEGYGACLSMPHKKNPVAALQALAAVQRAPQRVASLMGCMTPEHERGLGQHPAELAEWSGLMGGAHLAVQALNRALAEPVLRIDRMRAHVLERQGLVASERLEHLLMPRLGRQRTGAIVRDLISRVRLGQGTLQQLLLAAIDVGDLPPTALSSEELAAMFDLEAIAAQADGRVDALMADARRRVETLAATPWI